MYVKYLMQAFYQACRQIVISIFRHYENIDKKCTRVHSLCTPIKILQALSLRFLSVYRRKHCVLRVVIAEVILRPARMLKVKVNNQDLFTSNFTRNISRFIIEVNLRRVLHYRGFTGPISMPWVRYPNAFPQNDLFQTDTPMPPKQVMKTGVDEQSDEPGVSLGFHLLPGS